jgi:hypothetical protein
MRIFFVPIRLAEGQQAQELQHILAELGADKLEGELLVINALRDKPVKLILALRGLPDACLSAPETLHFEQAQEPDIRELLLELFAMAAPAKFPRSAGHVVLTNGFRSPTLASSSAGKTDSPAIPLAEIMCGGAKEMALREVG